MPCYKDKIEKEKNKFLNDIIQQRRIRQAHFLSSGYQWLQFESFPQIEDFI